MLSRRTVLAGLTGLAVTGPIIAEAADRFAAARSRAAELDQLWALVVAVDGEEVIADRLRGPALDRTVNVKSVSKTLVATLAGIAIERGHLPSVDAPVLDYLRDRAPSGYDPRAERVTIAHLLTMTSGFVGTSGENYGAWVQSPDWIGYILSRPLVAEPGRSRDYSTGDYHLLGAVLAEATGRSLHDLARSWIGEPLDVALRPWNRDPQGYFMGGNNMALSPRGLVAFGEAMRRGGEPLVGRKWLDAAWTPRTRSPYSGHEYGYGWFLARFGGERVAYARGYGGQMLYVLPEAGMTVAITSDPNRPARSRGYAGELNALVSDLLVPAARQA